MTGFELAVPDGWAHIPTTPEAVRRRDRLIDELIRFHVPDSLPRDKAGPWRRMLRRELTEAAEEAGQAGARGVLLRAFPARRRPKTLEDTGNVRSYPDGYRVEDLGSFPTPGARGCPVRH